MSRVAEFRVGTVIRRTIDILGGNMPPFLGLALLFEFLPQALSLALASHLAPAPVGAPGALAAVSTIPSGLLVFMIATMGKGAAVAAALAACEGRPWSFRSAVENGAAAFPSNLGVLILDYLGVGFASILLVVPGLMLMCRWVVAVPVSVAERPGVRAALGRSRDLTDGHRWPIFGLLVLFGLLSMIIPLVTLLMGFGRGGIDAGALVDALSATAFGLVGDVGMAVIYVELRSAKGGLPTPDLASAFE